MIPGDLVLGKPDASLKEPEDFLRKAVKVAPVFYAPGNHEQRMKLYPKVYGREYLGYEKRVQQMGVKILENRTERVLIKGQTVVVSGLAIPYEYYLKRRKTGEKDLVRLVGEADKEYFQILLAHTPKYAGTYLEWGGDLIFSGHYHGGMARLPVLGGVISPDWRLFQDIAEENSAETGAALLLALVWESIPSPSGF